MPFKDPEKRRAARIAWAERSSTTTYNKWLYDRRKLNQELMELFREALVLIHTRQGEDAPSPKYAAHILELAEQKERELGNRFDHLNQRPYYQEKKRKESGGPRLREDGEGARDSS